MSRAVVCVSLFARPSEIQPSSFNVGSQCDENNWVARLIVVPIIVVRMEKSANASLGRWLVTGPPLGKKLYPP